jgi:amino acid transporter/mannitol/fructose-specific phosphotransferase system IIA component (Ntr-type)
LKAPDRRKKGLKKSLGLVDVYAISTGAMFSSGFFLLPGLAFGLSGAWVIAAYLISALLVVPAMLAKAELSSAMPKAGGTYYFLDRSMGPLVGTVGGLGTWVAMGLKNTFALIGMGAYLGLLLDVPITAVALILTVVFTLFNIVGAKETAGLQRVLVFALVAILLTFVVAGIASFVDADLLASTKASFVDSPHTDITGVFATVGLVFVSYAGLTKAASVAEEVRDPDRNLIRGMTLSLLTAAFIYVFGSYVLVMVVDHDVLKTDLTPIATAAESIFSWLPAKVGLLAILVAAFAAFASTANAGIMAASRYLYAMGRDNLVPSRLASVGRFQTPTLGVLASSGFIVFAVLTLDVLTVAKLASAFQLLMFSLVNLAVIVMRESKIHAYDPAYRTPFYPWMQLFGIFSAQVLIIEMGELPMLFTLGLVAACVIWFFAYAKARVVRRGAIFHLFERLGRERFDPLNLELRAIMREKGLRADDPYDETIEAASVLDLDEGHSFAAAVAAASRQLAQKLPMTAENIAAEFDRGTRGGSTLVDHDVALPHFRAPNVDVPALVAVRVKGGVDIDLGPDHPSGRRIQSATAIFFLVSPEEDPGQHLRLLAKLASIVIERDEFLENWQAAADEGELRALVAR